MLIPYINKKTLLNLVSETEIFKRYLHDPDLNSKFTNPLREDNNPDCSFYIARSSGELRFKDFAYGYNWSCIDVVMIKYNLKYQEAINKILIDFRILDIDYNEVNNNPIIITKPNEIKLETTIEIKKRRFNQLDIDYWGQYYLEPEDLYYVYPTQHIWLNKSRFYNYSDKDPAYAYGLGNNKYKCYFPLRKTYRFIQSGNYIQGLRLLPKQDDNPFLIITKAYKDVLLLKKLGYYAIAPASEYSIIEKEILEKLKVKFNHIVLFLDNDEVGRYNSQKQSELYQIPEIYIPETYPKDISDFVKQEGLDAGFDLIEYLTNK